MSSKCPNSLIAPSLDKLEPGDSFLNAVWTNNPYVDINNAYLLVVKKSDLTLKPVYIFLTELEALEGSWRIPNLDNNIEYLVQYCQTQLTANGEQGCSNTLLGRPVPWPSPATINSYTILPRTNDDRHDVRLNVVFPYKPSEYNPPLDEIIFKIVRNDIIYSREFSLKDQVIDTSHNFLIEGIDCDDDGFESGHYYISSFNVNENGVGPISNVVDVNIISTPDVANVISAVSLMDRSSDLVIRVQENTLYSILSIDIFASSDFGNTWTAASTISPPSPDTSGNITVSANIPGLTNGVVHTFKARAVNANGAGAFGSTATAVPALPTIIDSLEASGTTGSILTSATPTPGTFTGPLFKIQVLTLEDGIVAEFTSNTSSFANYDPLGLTAGRTYKAKVWAIDLIPEHLSFYISEPVFTPSNQWSHQVSALLNEFTTNGVPPALDSITAIGLTDIATLQIVLPTYYYWNMPTSINLAINVNGTELAPVVLSVVPGQSTYTFNSDNYPPGTIINVIGTLTNFVGDSTPLSGGPFTIIDEPDPMPSPTLTPLYSSNNIIGAKVAWPVYSMQGYSVLGYGVDLYSRPHGGGYSKIYHVDTDPNNFDTTFSGGLYFGDNVKAVVTAKLRANQTNVQSSVEATSNEELIAMSPVITSYIITRLSNNTDAAVEINVDARGSPLTGVISIVIPDVSDQPVSFPNIIKQPSFDRFNIGPQRIQYNTGYSILELAAVFVANGLGSDLETHE